MEKATFVKQAAKFSKTTICQSILIRTWAVTGAVILEPVLYSTRPSSYLSLSNYDTKTSWVRLPAGLTMCYMPLTKEFIFTFLQSVQLSNQRAYILGVLTLWLSDVPSQGKYCTLSPFMSLKSRLPLVYRRVYRLRSYFTLSWYDDVILTVNNNPSVHPKSLTNLDWNLISKYCKKTKIVITS